MVKRVSVYSNYQPQKLYVDAGGDALLINPIPKPYTCLPASKQCTPFSFVMFQCPGGPLWGQQANIKLVFTNSEVSNSEVKQRYYSFS